MTNQFADLFKSSTPVPNDEQLVFRLPKAQKEAFLALCKAHNTEPATVLRKFVAAQVTTPTEGRR